MNSFEKPVQKHYRFPFFSLPREVRDIIYRALFVSDGFVDYYGIDTFFWMPGTPGTYEMLKSSYEATTNLDFLQESLEMFFRDNVFSVLIQDMAFLMLSTMFSVRAKELMALPPYFSEESIQTSTTWELGRPAPHGDHPDWVFDDKSKLFYPVLEENFSLLPEHEWKVPKFSPRDALEMSTRIRSILVPNAYDQDLILPEHNLLGLCKLPNLQNVSIMTRIDRWPLVQRGKRAEAAAAACLKELRSRFGKGLRLIYSSRKEERRFHVTDSFIDLLCAGTDAGEGDDEWEEDWSDIGQEESQWTEDWLEEQFHPLEGRLVDHVRSC